MRRTSNHTAVEKIHPEEQIRAVELAAAAPTRTPSASRLRTPGGKAYGSMREAVCYLTFLVVFGIVTVYNRGTSSMFYYSDSVARAVGDTSFPSGDDSNVDISLAGVETLGDVWNWLQGPVANTFFPTTASPVLGANQVIGNVRLRQVRVKPNSCSPQSQYATLVSYCYGALSPSSESTVGFGPVLNSDGVSAYAAYTFASTYFGASKSYAQLLQCISGCEIAVGGLYGIDKARYAAAYTNTCSLSCTCFYSGGNCVAPSSSAPSPVYIYNWTSSDVTQSNALQGLFGSIPGSGFVVDLPTNVTDARLVLRALKSAKYIDIATRAVVLEAAIFNPYLELFNLVTVVLELPPTGGVYTSFTSSVVELSAYSSSAAGKIFFEGLLVIGVVLYTLELLFGMLRHSPRKYFSSFWNIAHGINIALFIAVITLRLAAINSVYGATIDWSTIDTASVLSKLHFLSTLGRQERSVNAMNALLTWAVVFKYAQMSQSMFLLLRVLAKASADLWSFLLLFCICLLGYAQAGFVAFSTQAPSFHTFGQGLVTLIEALRFRLDYAELAAANAGFAPVFFASFYMLVILIALNVFAAILHEAYATMDKDLVYKYAFPFPHGVLAAVGFTLQRTFVAIKYGREAANAMMQQHAAAPPAAVLDRSLKKGDVHPWMMMEMQALTEKVQGMLSANDEKKAQFETMEAMLRAIEDTCMELKVAAKPLAT
ncbi:hypothetical protein SPRG_04619 [Saprolegnia parasitica CBS 223.65]|uniref:Uncharacterized protein n=1 Tax=Saprolegnia parasitica (strain CBS 223.65) TaxID=695850 RepID=A0A067CVB7_SAPPC|nr:hypothetical protein SPRG_04619 [Saprolegnia parasitica CBS 223.65]KDO30717.1 hypothetical protein SPRG_04619 [Saprolegnia parasitica CBS 223.65]|eukprot:XP_012198419.1 hypothetical protein SPRG_04619 [Saprolegnia parasitica CBS 223.65]